MPKSNQIKSNNAIRIYPSETNQQVKFTFIQMLFLLDDIYVFNKSSDKVRVHCSLSLGLLNTEHKPSVTKTVDRLTGRLRGH